MEKRRLKSVVLFVLAVGMATAVEQSSASFKDCYTKCFVFCMIEPTQTLCSCTTHCLKDCIFQEIQNDLRDQQPPPDSDNLGFCKLGCAFSMCSTFSSKHKPNGEKVDSCVGSCSNKCIKSYP